MLDTKQSKPLQMFGDHICPIKTGQKEGTGKILSGIQRPIMFGFGKIAFETISTRSLGGYFLVNTSCITRSLLYTIGCKMQYISWVYQLHIVSFGHSGINTRMTRTERYTRALHGIPIQVRPRQVLYYRYCIITTVMNETGEPTISCRAIITVRRGPTPRAGRT